MDVTHRPLAIMVHGLHKSGTMFLYQLCFRLCRERKIRLFSANHPQPNEHLANADVEVDFCVAPLRTFQTSTITASPRHRVRRIFQVRDPRDILVSQFHSLGWRHTEEGFTPQQSKNRAAIRQLTLDQYVLDEELALKPLVRRYEVLMSRPPQASDRIVHYEQMVTDFPGWLARFVPAFDFSRPNWICRKYSLKYRREFQADPDPDAHKRSVVPGRYAAEINCDTIRRLNARLEPVLRAFGYPLENC
jgi:hypothetical protein